MKKHVLDLKKLILTSEQCAEHPFAGPNTQHMSATFHFFHLFFYHSSYSPRSSYLSSNSNLSFYLFGIPKAGWETTV